MELLHRFKKTLGENGSSASKVTAKNYIADIRKFIAWYEAAYNRNFAPSALPAELVDRYLTPLRESSPRSAKRYASSLRKFFAFLVTERIITYNPLVSTAGVKRPEDLWHMRDFDNYLYNTKSSPLTRKNYINDVNQFLNWVEAVTRHESGMISNSTQAFAKISTFLIEQYRNRLMDEADLSPLSINRKLSSLRKYINFAKNKGLLKNQAEVGQSIQTIPTQTESELDADTEITPEPSLQELQKLQAAVPEANEEKLAGHSGHAPVRLFQKLHTGMDYLFDALVILSIVKGIEAAKYNLWKATGKQVFASMPEVIKSLQDAGEIASGSIGMAAGSLTSSSKNITQPLSALDKLVKGGQTSLGQGKFRGIPKSVYAPIQISTKALSFWGKTVYYIRFYRPNWYKRYHKHAFVHYMHFAIVLVFAVFLGLRTHQAFNNPQNHVAVLASKVSPTRIIAFQGSLYDSGGTPITQESLLRFAIYNSPTASGSALLWEETQKVRPDTAGRFSTSLGKKAPMSQDIFMENAQVYLGISIGSSPELSPRQELANTGLSQNAQELQGLKPITGNNAQTENVILALDSSGNLTIGGNSAPIFQATGGEFKLSGQQLTLATNEGTNTNIVLAPDGTGIIDLQKPLQNTSNNNNLSDAIGAVEIDDNLAILASTSAQSALVINQNGSGDLISASTGGSARFSVSNSGTVKIGEDLNILGNNLTTATGTFSLANTNTLNLNIGGAATSISLGAATGTTTINHNLSVKGTITATGGVIIPEFKEGSIPFTGPSGKLTSDNTSLFWDSVNKRLGLGTGTPAVKLDVQDSQLAGVANITNLATGNTSVGLNLKLGTTTAPQAGNRWINFLDGNGAILGKIRGNNSTNTVTFDSNGGDFAEYFLKANQSEAMGPGDLICYSKSSGVEKCNSDSNGILGIYSDNAGFVGAGGHENDPKYVLVGLIGQLKLRISQASEAIKPGDPIALSTESGVGAKATTPGQIVGRALESFDPTYGSKSIKISLNTSWYDPRAVLMDDGRLAVAFENTAENENVDKLDEKLVLSIQNFVNTLEAGVLEVQHVSVQSLTVATEDIKIGTKTLRDYIAGIVNEILDKRLAEEKDKTIIVISPLAQVSAEASISATLEAPEETNETNGTKEASPAASISSVPSGSSSSSANITNITNIYNTISSPSAALTPTVQPSPSASPSATPALSPVPYTPTPSPEASPSAAPPTLISEDAKETNETKETITSVSSVPSVSLNTSYANVATFSAELAYIPNLKSDFATFHQGLIALGPTSLTDTSINGQFTIGQNMKIDENSINTISGDLNLQPLRQGNLSIMSGLVNIDTEGNLTVEGNATFAKNVNVIGTLAAGIISPLADSDLIVKVGGKKQNSTDERGSEFVVADQNGSNKLRINDLGDIISSGSASFANFKLIRGAQADTSFIETVASGSAGTAVITTNETERTIITPFVTADSLIYITPVSDTKGTTPYIARQTVEDPVAGSKGSFTIQVPAPQTADIKLNWVIVN